MDNKEAASSPHTPPEMLARLVHEHPELQPQIADNPAIYVSLLEWISRYGTDEGKAAARARLAESAPEVSTRPPGKRGRLVAGIIFFSVIIIALVVWLLVVIPWNSLTDTEGSSQSAPLSSQQSELEASAATKVDPIFEAVLKARQASYAQVEVSHSAAHEKMGTPTSY